MCVFLSPSEKEKKTTPTFWRRGWGKGACFGGERSPRGWNFPGSNAPCFHLMSLPLEMSNLYEQMLLGGFIIPQLMFPGTLRHEKKRSKDKTRNLNMSTSTMRDCVVTRGKVPKGSASSLQDLGGPISGN